MEKRREKSKEITIDVAFSPKSSMWSCRHRNPCMTERVPGGTRRHRSEVVYVCVYMCACVRVHVCVCVRKVKGKGERNEDRSVYIYANEYTHIDVHTPRTNNRGVKCNAINSTA